MYPKYNQLPQRGCSSSNIKGTSAKALGGWAEGSSKVWFRKCSIMLSACLMPFGTYPPPPPGPRFCLRARSTSVHPTPDLNRAEIKHHLPSTCLTSALQEPSGKSQGFFFFYVPFLNPAPKHHASSLSRVCKQTAHCKGLSGRQKTVWSSPSLQPKLRRHQTLGTACPLLVSLSSMEGQELGRGRGGGAPHSQRRTDPWPYLESLY